MLSAGWYKMAVMLGFGGFPAGAALACGLLVGMRLA